MAKTREQKLFGAAVLKVSFQLQERAESPAFKVVYPGVLRDLGLEDKDVDEFIASNREAVEKAARGAAE